jgi:Transcriptional regulator
LTKRDQQKLERREQILLCSLDMIISRGYEAMKIRDIADQLDISTGLFFNYFESKEKIYEELVKIGISGPSNVFKLNTEDIDPIEFFEKMTAAIFESLETDSITAKMFLLMADAMKSESAPENVKKLVAQFDVISPSIPVILRGQASGKIKPGNPAALVAAYWGAVQGIAESYALWPNMPMPEVSWIVDILRA